MIGRPKYHHNISDKEILISCQALHEHRYNLNKMFNKWKKAEAHCKRLAIEIDDSNEMYSELSLLFEVYQNRMIGKNSELERQLIRYELENGVKDIRIAELRAENPELREKYEELLKENQELKLQLIYYECKNGSGETFGDYKKQLELKQ